MAEQERNRRPSPQLHRTCPRWLSNVTNEQRRGDREDQHLRVPVELGRCEQRGHRHHEGARPASDAASGSGRDGQRQREQTHGEHCFDEKCLTENALRDRRQLVAERRPCTHHPSVGEVPEGTLTVRHCPRAKVVNEVIAVESTERAAECVEAVQKCDDKNDTRHQQPVSRGTNDRPTKRCAHHQSRRGFGSVLITACAARMSSSIPVGLQPAAAADC